MPRVRLTRYQVEGNRLPQLCMRCGAPATLTLEKTFSWHPQWIDTITIVGLIFFWPALIVGLILAGTMTKRMSVPVPLCDAHRNHWRWRAWFIYGGLAVAVLLGIGAFAFLLSVPPSDPDTQAVAGWTCGGTALAGFIWLIAAAFVQRGAIYASEITDDEISLNRVCPAFKEAATYPYRHGHGFDDEEGSPRFPTRQKEERVFDPDAEKRKDLPPDAYREGEP
jgi:hypothetical protein